MYSAIAWGGPAHGKLIAQPASTFRCAVGDTSHILRPPKAPSDTRTRWQRFVNALTGVCPPPDPVIERTPFVEVTYRHEQYCYGNSLLFEVWLPDEIKSDLSNAEVKRIYAYVKSRLSENEPLDSARL